MKQIFVPLVSWCFFLIAGASPYNIVIFHYLIPTVLSVTVNNYCLFLTWKIPNCIRFECSQIVIYKSRIRKYRRANIHIKEHYSLNSITKQKGLNAGLSK